MENENDEKKYLKDKKCPKCKQEIVVYLGMEVIQGNIYTPAADTEVEHSYKCMNPKCNHSWVEYA